MDGHTHTPRLLSKEAKHPMSSITIHVHQNKGPHHSAVPPPLLPPVSTDPTNLSLCPIASTIAEGMFVRPSGPYACLLVVAFVGK